MNHTKSNVVVYTTQNYGQFRKITGNRDHNKSTIKKILTDINQGNDLLSIHPICVDDEMHVIDGQHRLEAAKKSKRPIYYIIADKKDVAAIARMNSAQARWKANDFIQCYSKRGIEDYKQLDSFCKQWGVGIHLACILLIGKINDNGGGNKTVRDIFEGGVQSNRPEVGPGTAYPVKQFFCFRRLAQAFLFSCHSQDPGGKTSRHAHTNSKVKGCWHINLRWLFFAQGFPSSFGEYLQLQK